MDLILSISSTDYIDRFYNEKRSSAQAARVKQAMSKKKMLDKMELVDDPRLEVRNCEDVNLRASAPTLFCPSPQIDVESLTLRFPSPGIFKKSTIIQTDDMTFGYDPEHPILKNISVTVEKDSRIGILGRNGAGKSTLINCMLVSCQS